MKTISVTIDDNRYDILCEFLKCVDLTIEGYLLKLINATLSPYDDILNINITLDDFKKSF